MQKSREQIKGEVGDIYLACVKNEEIEKYPLHEVFEKSLVEYVYDIANAPAQATDLTLMMMSKAREIDRELILELGQIVGHEKLVEVARIVTERHKHFKDGTNSEVKKETEATQETEAGAGTEAGSVAS